MIDWPAASRATPACDATSPSAPARRARAAPQYHLVRQGHSLTCRHFIEQDGGCKLTKPAARLANRRQRRIREGSVADIVKADHGEIGGDGKPCLFCSGD